MTEPQGRRSSAENSTPRDRQPLGLSLPTNQSEFEEMMERVNKSLRQQGVPPHARPLRGWLDISGELKLGLRLPFERHTPQPGRYVGDDLSTRILDWFESRYGSKLNINPGPGRSFMIIRGDPWVMHFPQIWGQVDFFASRDRREESGLNPARNVINLLEEFPEGLAKSLTDRELETILTYFAVTFDHLQVIATDKKNKYRKEIGVDLDTSVALVMRQEPHYPQSKWASLQAAEKSMKGFLIHNGETPKKNHDIRHHAERVRAHGVSEIQDDWLDAIWCTPASRYGEESATLEDAWKAHQGAIRVCGLMSKNLMGV